MKNTYFKAMTSLFNFNNFNEREAYYYPRYSYYERFLDKYSSGQFYNDLVNKLTRINEIKTNAEIQYLEDKIFNNTVLDDIIRKNGNPNYKIVYKDLLDFKVFFYKQKIGKYKIKMEFHFFKNNLFFYSYTFINTSLEEKDEIIQVLKNKYFVDTSQDLINSFIVDSNNNSILLDDGLVFSIYYLCDNKIAFDKIMEYIELKKIKDSYHRMRYEKILYKKL